MVGWGRVDPGHGACSGPPGPPSHTVGSIPATARAQGPRALPLTPPSPPHTPSQVINTYLWGVNPNTWCHVVVIEARPSCLAVKGERGGGKWGGGGGCSSGGVESHVWVGRASFHPPIPPLRPLGRARRNTIVPVVLQKTVLLSRLSQLLRSSFLLEAGRGGAGRWCLCECGGEFP